MKIKRFWSDGLEFSCTQCGQCCCGEPGIVYFNPEEFEKLVEHLGKTKNLDRETIIREYMWPYRDSYTARDDFPDGHCIFFDKGCTVYEVRPSRFSVLAMQFIDDCRLERNGASMPWNWPGQALER